MKKTLLLFLIFGASVYIFTQIFDTNKDLTLQEELMARANSDQVDAFKSVLESKSDSTIITFLNTKGCDLLQKVAAAGSLKVAKFLLFEKNLDVNCDEDSPLYAASAMGRVDMVRFLLQQGGKIRPKGYSAETCLHVAAGTNPEKWVEPEKYDLTKIDLLSVVKLLVAYKADVNSINKNEETPLHKAAFVQNYAIVQFLLENKADVNAKDAYGQTPLHNATFTNKDNRVCALLLANKANSSAKNNKGQTPILWGQSNVDTSTIQLFIKYGYDPIRDIDTEGQTLLHKALANGQFGTIEYLLNNNAEVNLANRQGRTPLHIAAELRGESGLIILKRLLAAGADINPVDIFGHTPLFNAARVIEGDQGTYYPDTMIVNLLIIHGAHL